MAYRITIKDKSDQAETYTAIGDPRGLMDAAYDRGAFGVAIIEVAP